LGLLHESAEAKEFVQIEENHYLAELPGNKKTVKRVWATTGRLECEPSDADPSFNMLHES
jgi:hypothetical protein